MLKYLLLFFLAFPCFADEWTDADTAREATFQTLATIDWLQTRNIARNPEVYWEQYNAVLGNHPSIGQVNNTFAVWMIGHYLVSKYLPQEFRAPFQYVTIGVEVGDVVHNFSIGLSAHF